MSLCLFVVLYKQNKYEYKSTNVVFNMVELHMAMVIDFEKNWVINLGILLLEIIWLQVFQHHVRHLYCIGRGMTLEELRTPYLFVHQSIGHQFKHTKFKKNGARKVNYFSFFTHNQVGPCTMLWRIIRYAICCRKAVTYEENTDRLYK